jgi:ssDNA-specific exonuclease RecJ
MIQVLGTYRHNLADKLQIKESQLYRRLTKDDDILLILLLSFESDIMDFLKELNNLKTLPKTN